MARRQGGDAKMIVRLRDGMMIVTSEPDML